MSIQSNTLGCRLDLDLDLYDPFEAKSTTKLKIKELDIVVDSLDTGSVKKGILEWRIEHTYQAGCYGLRQPWW